MDIYEIFLHNDSVTIQLSLEDAERLGIAPQHAVEETEKEDKPRDK